MTTEPTAEELRGLSEAYTDIKAQIGEFMVGNEELIDLMMVGMLSNGHVLIEGVPGTAKTSLVKAMATLLGCGFRRIQCAVDTQPADILGVRIYNPDSREFDLRKGPIFTNVVLIDEVNRLPPKSQSAFIEAMSERQTTIDGITLSIEDPFFAIGTQNPLEQEGTFPLIEAQKDRFMFSIRSQFLASDEELEIIRREQGGRLDWKAFEKNLRPVLNAERIERMITLVQKIHIEDNVQQYMRDLVMATRAHAGVKLGVSSRGSIALVRGTKAEAALHNRSYVIPDDVKAIARMAFSHRIILQREAEISGDTPKGVIREILSTVEVP